MKDWSNTDKAWMLFSVAYFIFLISDVVYFQEKRHKRRLAEIQKATKNFEDIRKTVFDALKDPDKVIIVKEGNVFVRTNKELGI